MAEDNVIIRLATYDDIDKIMEAIKNHWDAQHILAHNKEFFLYMFSGGGDKENMVIACDTVTGEILGFKGFVKYSNKEPCDIAGYLWKNIDNKRGMIGMKMLLYEKKELKYNLFIGVGANPVTAVPIYKRLGFYTGKFDHFYRILDKHEYKIAKIENKNILPVIKSDFYCVLINDYLSFKKMFETLPASDQRPYRDILYYKHRLFEHPYFKYHVYAIKTDQNPGACAFFACREVGHSGTKALRIVDIFGKEEYFAQISWQFQQLMEKYNYEFIDCYSIGISEKTMNSAGFAKRTDNDKNIIPNYFEPFVCENIDIYYNFSDIKNIRILRADGDQDQPRLFAYHR